MWLNQDWCMSFKYNNIDYNSNVLILLLLLLTMFFLKPSLSTMIGILCCKSSYWTQGLPIRSADLNTYNISMNNNKFKLNTYFLIHFKHGHGYFDTFYKWIICILLWTYILAYFFYRRFHLIFNSEKKYIYKGPGTCKSVTKNVHYLKI